jgi:fumarate hydratase class II
MSASFRVEKDSMGEVRIPADALWGAQTQRAVHNFPISGFRPRPEYIWAMAAVKRAAAEVNRELGLLPADVSAAICQAAEEVMQGQWNTHFVVDPFQAGAGTSHNMNANEVIANRAAQILGGEIGGNRVHPNDQVNMAQSTNDVIPTAIRLACLYRLEELLGGVDALAQALETKAVEFDGIIKSGRTHLQDAVPIRLGQEFSGYAQAAQRDAERIRRSSEGLRRLGIGGTAAGTGLNAHPQYAAQMILTLARVTGFRLHGSNNLFESMQSMADFADFSASLRTLAVTVTRIANDLRLLSSGPATGLDEIRLPAVQPGSSIMPGKVNPVMAEMTNMAMYHVIGCDTAVMLAAQAGQLELNVMMPVIAHNLFEMMHITTNTLTAFTKRCVSGISANPQAARRWLEKNSAIVTVLNPLIGYLAGAALVKEAAETSQTIYQLAMQKAAAGQLTHIQQQRPLTTVEVENALSNLRKLTEGGLTG